MSEFEVAGTLFQRGDAASPEVFSTVGEVTSLPSATPSRTIHDVTAINDTSMQKKPSGLTDGGTMTVEFSYDKDDTEQSGLIDDYDNATLRNFKIVLADGSPETEITFSAYVQDYTTPQGGPGDIMTMSVTLNISGSVSGLGS